MLNKLTQIFKIKDLRKKIFFILLVFVIFRLMSAIPMPGINADNLQEFFARYKMMGFLSVLTGGALSRFSIIMLGIGPYITSVIILQLLTMIFPALERMYKEEGEAGKKKFNQWGRLLTIPLAFLQNFVKDSVKGFTRSLKGFYFQPGKGFVVEYSQDVRTILG